MTRQVTPRQMLRTDHLAARRFELMAAEYLQRMGLRIKERREEMDLSQEALARALPGKTTGNQISRWERGQHRPSDDVLERLAEVLGVDVAYFLATPPDKSETPDLIGAMNGAGERSQLDRIEQLLEDNATQVKRGLRMLEDDLAELTRQIDELRAAALERVAADALDTTAGRDAEPGDADRRDQRN